MTVESNIPCAQFSLALVIPLLLALGLLAPARGMSSSEEDIMRVREETRRESKLFATRNKVVGVV